jgi:hypothetical protein
VSLYGAVHEQVCELEKFLAIDAGFRCIQISLTLLKTRIRLSFEKARLLGAGIRTTPMYAVSVLKKGVPENL